MMTWLKSIGFLVLAAGTAVGLFSPEEFVKPPESAKPRTWMHVMNRNITQEGFEKDLQFSVPGIIDKSSLPKYPGVLY